MVPTPPHPLIAAVPRRDDDEPTDELAYVRPADAAERDPSRRARRASREAVDYLSARRRRLRRRLEEAQD